MVINTSNWTEVSGIPAISARGRDCSFNFSNKFLAVAHDVTPLEGVSVISANISPTEVQLPTPTSELLVSEAKLYIKALP
jgi:hypothetical protein